MLQTHMFLFSFEGHIYNCDSSFAESTGNLGGVESMRETRCGFHRLKGRQDWALCAIFEALLF